MDRGRNATDPSGISTEGWKDVLWRVWQQITNDRVTLIAAGAAFYLLLALFPALAVLVSIFGFFADPASIVDQIVLLQGVLPTAGIEFIQAQLLNLANQNEATLSVGFAFGFLLTLWSANNGIKTLFEAMNIAYGEVEKRSFVRLNLITFVFTLGAVVVSILFIGGVGVLPAVLGLVGMSQFAETVIALLRWPLLFGVAVSAISLLYRYGPSRENAKWRWVTWGGILATVLWLVTSILFSWYLTNFANYNATYGSLGAVVGFMMWVWVSVVVLIMGAELNAEMEHQTARDSTAGPEKPIGTRGATMADTIGRSRNSEKGESQRDVGDVDNQSAVKDDLQEISLIGPALESRLNAIGVTRFDQIAGWDKSDIERIESKIGFKGQHVIEDLIVEARRLDDHSAT